jgi:hypothetical protein
MIRISAERGEKEGYGFEDDSIVFSIARKT